MAKIFRVASVANDQQRTNAEHLKRIYSSGWYGQYTTLDGRRVTVALSRSKKEALKELARLQEAVYTVE